MTREERNELQRWRRRLRRIHFELHQVISGNRAGEVAISTPGEEDPSALGAFLQRYGWNALAWEAFRAAGYTVRSPYDLPPRLFFIRGPVTNWRELKGRITPYAGLH